MTECSGQPAGAIALYFYDELDAAGRASMERHLPTCRECRAALEDMRVIASALAARPDVSAPPGGDWTPFMDRLDRALGVEGRPHGSSRAPMASRSLVPYLAMAALLSLVTSGVGYVAYLRLARPAVTKNAAATPGPPPPAASVTPQSTRTPDRALATLSEQHFERSKLVVLGLASKNPRAVAPADWAYERQLASSLLSDTRLYRQAAEERGLQTLAGVMSDLELVLLQASLSDTRDAETLGRLQQLIRKRDLVTKMELVGSSGM